MAKKKLYRSEVKVIILTEDADILGELMLDEIVNGIQNNEIGGEIKHLTTNTEMVGRRAVLEVEKFGQDVEFFNMDTQGNELED